LLTQQVRRREIAGDERDAGEVTDARRIAHDRDDVVTSRNEKLDDGSPDEPRGSGDDDSHARRRAQ
jgi:hypothetical protein